MYEFLLDACTIQNEKLLLYSQGLLHSHSLIAYNLAAQLEKNFVEFFKLCS